MKKKQKQQEQDFPHIAPRVTYCMVCKNAKLPSSAPRITYCMVCPEGQYVTKSWISLGWAVLKHRLWHLFKHGKWTD